jgi:hypothetical protein
MTNVKLEMRKKARIIKGLVNLLQNDAEYICVDAEDFDLIGLGESIPEMKETIQKLVDQVTELEYDLYLTRK